MPPKKNSKNQPKNQSQQLNAKEKQSITDDFLIDTCYRCGKDHPCEQCSYDVNSAGVQAPGYGKMSVPKRRGADEFIEELKKEYHTDPDGPRFAIARARRAAQNAQATQVVQPAQAAHLPQATQAAQAAPSAQPTQTARPIQAIQSTQAPQVQPSAQAHRAVPAEPPKKMQQDKDMSRPIAEQKIQEAKKSDLVGASQQITKDLRNVSIGDSDAHFQGSLPPAPAAASANLVGNTPDIDYSFHYDKQEVKEAPPPKGLKRNPAAPRRDDHRLALQKLKSRELDYPTRTEFAKYTKNTKLITNHYQLFHDTSDKIILHEFKIPELEKMTKVKARAIIKSLIANFITLKSCQHQFATDYYSTIVAWVDLRQAMASAGHTLISAPGEAHQYHLATFPEGPISLKYVRTVNMKDLFACANMDQFSDDLNIQMMAGFFNIIISKCVEQSSIGTIPGGANKFYRKDAHVLINPRCSLSLHRGYSFSVKAGVGAVLLNVNTLTSAFWRPITLDKVLNDDTYAAIDWDIFERMITGLKVYINYQRGDRKKEPEAYERLNSDEARIKPIAGLGRDANTECFKQDDGKVITVREHYRKTHGINIVQDWLQLINLGRKDDPRWYPAEQLTVLPYQRYKGMIPSSITGRMIQVARCSPESSKALVGVEGLEMLGVSMNASANNTGIFSLPSCSTFALQPSLLRVDGGILNAPEIQYGNGKVSTQNKGHNSGRWKFPGKEFFKHNASKKIRTLVLHEKGIRQDVKKIFNDLQLWSGVNRYQVAEVTYAGNHELVGLSQERCADEVRKPLEQGGPASANMAVLLLKGKNPRAYSAFKDLCDRKYGYHALCMARLDNQNGDYWSNIALKMNLKMAGTNHTVAGNVTSNVMKDTLVLGADVTHPGPGSIPGCPSIASIVGSVDSWAGRFLGSMRLQHNSKTEIIDEVEAMVYERIKDWVEEMKPATQSQPTLPKRILYYRDGVNEPQYQDIRVNELPAIRRAWNRFVQELSKKNGSEATTKSPNMDIIAIVCGKRHHVRFYPETGDRNCPPGTTVDDLVTSPCYQDFYLQSHTTTQGTARPAHYFVIANEPNMSVTQLREFTNQLCYTYVRAPVSVSYASPAYYADRLCERGRHYLRDFFVAGNNERFRSQYNDLRKKEEQLLKNDTKQAFPSGHPKRKGKARPLKNRDLLERQREDTNTLKHTCDKWVMEKARIEFEKYRTGNPWHPNISKTMFWM